MIKFALRCDNGHGFESWFRDSASYSQQVRRGFVECPQCGSTRVEKAIMAPNVARSDRRLAPPLMVADSPAVEPSAAPSLPVSPADKALRDLVRAMRRHVEANADNVGDRFADEALSMHHGEQEHRPIYGSATPEDVRMLAEEGVGFMPLPTVPDERN